MCVRTARVQNAYRVSRARFRDARELSIAGRRFRREAAGPQGRAIARQWAAWRGEPISAP